MLNDNISPSVNVNGGVMPTNSRKSAMIMIMMIVILPISTITTSAGNSKSVTGNENIEIHMDNYNSLPNLFAFQTGEMINWNLTWSGVDSSISNFYSFDYTIHAGYANNGTLTFNGSGQGFNSTNGTISFSFPAYEFWINTSYEYTLRFVLWDQNRNQLLDYAEKEFIIFESTIQSNISKLLIFGDSLSDMGNSKSAYGTPESPPYYNGRFSTGPMWNEHVAAGMGINISPGAGSGTGSNRAFGGAEAGEGMNFFVIPNLGKQIEDYTNNYWISPNEKVMIWGGGNNFLNSGETDTQKVVDYVVNHVNDVFSNGAKDIVVINMPPLEKTPSYSGESQNNKQAFHDRLKDYNSKLESAMISRESALNISIQVIDVFQMFETIYWNGSFYGISNVTHAACHHDGFSCDSNDYIEPTVDEFIFFDKIHPTGTTHQLLGMYVLEQIGQSDIDGDGIGNHADNCPKTPVGDLVNHFGCRLADLDTDNDGVNDLLDQCPGTNAGSIVDDSGCADYQKDTDEDGVTDDIDICPNTLANIEVDSLGCAEYQKDTDGDGVTDDIDICPDTEIGVEINLIGCAQNQIDDDWDGVMNDVDQCPNTTPGELVNNDGCSLSQLDSDVDGVTDNLDNCPDTPNGLDVDKYGCALTQIDSDSDGVSDAIDICDFTPLDEIADELGCSPTQRDSDGDGRNDALDECIYTSGSIRGCPTMSLSVDVLHWPMNHNDTAILLINSSCENDCKFTTIIGNQTFYNQSSGEYEIEVLPSIGELELLLRIEHDVSWMEKKVNLFWPEPPLIEENNSDLTSEKDDEIIEQNIETIESNQWQLSSTVEFLLAVLFFIGIGLTIGSIIRMNRTRNPKLIWDENPSSISTLEVERELIQNSEIPQDDFSDPSTIPSVDELFD